MEIKELEEYLTKNWSAITNYMDFDICEKIHNEIAPCSNYAFLKRYCELDSEFGVLLKQEFDSDILWEFV